MNSKKNQSPKASEMACNPEARTLLQNAVKHFQTVQRHRHRVFLHCKKAGIPWQGLFHDLSKFSPEEFIPGVLYYQGVRSPNERERECKRFSKAWMHHKGRNKHHFEYWTDYSPVTRSLEAVEMPFLYVVEMFCDRVAASKVYRKDAYRDEDPLNYFLSGRKNRFIHPKTSGELEGMLRMLAEQGEDATFAYIRKRVRKYRKRNS